MIDQLPAFLAYVLGSALAYECTLLVGFIVVLNLKTVLKAALRRLER